MLIEGIDTGVALLEAGVNTNINERAKYTANTGIALISVANPYLDGSGDIQLVISGDDKGTLIKTITIKGIVSTTRGMVRLFVNGTFSGATLTLLIDEIEIPAVIQSGIAESFEISYDLDYFLAHGFSLYASTQNDESFTVIADGLNFTY